MARAEAHWMSVLWVLPQAWSWLTMASGHFEITAAWNFSTALATLAAVIGITSTLAVRAPPTRSTAASETAS